jgi:polyisoprenoid-binding protein YceI
MIRTAILVLALAASFAAAAAPVEYKLDPNHTVVLASWSHFGYSHPSANFGHADGTLVYDADDVTNSSVEVTLPLSGLDTFVPKLDEHLRSAEFFDAAKYPDIRFKSTMVHDMGGGKLMIMGDLTVHGVTRPVTLDATLNKAEFNPMFKADVIGFDATTTIKRSEFGVGGGVPMVGDDVTIRITTEAKSPKPEAAKK